MNLHQAVRAMIPVVNPDVTVTLLTSTGYTTADNGNQIPTYATQAGVQGQMQALSSGDLAHLDSLNIQGVLRGFWLNGSIEGVNRLTMKGGDLIVLGDGRKWLVVRVLETWDASGWCHVAGLLQEE